MVRSFAAVFLVAGAATVPASAQPAAGNKDFDKTIVATLRDIHDRGADLYNLSKDYGAAYRLYEGSLLTVKPLLAHRPDIQKSIQDGLATADKETDAARKAFLLHEAIEKVRTDLKGPAPLPKVEPKPKDPVPMPMPKPKEPEPKPKADVATISGKVTVQGKLLAEGTVTFASPDPKGKSFAGAIDKDGAFVIKDVAPGKYLVSVTGKVADSVPVKFAKPETSGLTFTAQAGTNPFDIELK